METCRRASPDNLPHAIRLNRQFDIECLQQDLDIALASYQSLPQYGPYHDGSWQGIALISFDGSYKNVLGIPQGAGKPTEVLQACHYFRQVIEALNCTIVNARLLFLPPGKKIHEHKDHASWKQGLMRLHIPIVTNPGVALYIDGHREHWGAGEFWFGDFSRPHRVENLGSETRAHLVIDCLLNEALLTLFPADDIATIRTLSSIGLAARQQVPDPAALNALTGYFHLPKGLFKPHLPILCSLKPSDDFLDLSLCGFTFKQRFFAVGNGEFEGAIYSADLFHSAANNAINKKRYDGHLCRLHLNPENHNQICFTLLDSGQQYTVTLRKKLGPLPRLQWLLQLGVGKLIAYTLNSLVYLGHLKNRLIHR